MIKEATLSEDNVYRYSLLRRWGHNSNLVFVMLNPSTADAHEDDPTIRRCIGFAKGFGYGGVRVVNLFAFRATDPQAMKAATDPVGPMNNTYLEDHAFNHDVVLAYGNHGTFQGRDRAVFELIKDSAENIYSLKINKGNIPAHPLYLKADLPLTTYGM